MNPQQQAGIQAILKANNYTPPPTPGVPATGGWYAKIKPSIPAPVSTPTGGNVVTETGKNYAANLQPATKDLMGGGNIGAAVDDLSKGHIASGIEHATLGTASDAVQAIFAPLAAPIQTLLSHVASSNAANPSITGKEIASPQAQQARQQLADWAKAHPDIARTLNDAFTVGTAAAGSGALDTSLSDIAATTKNTLTKGYNAVKDAVTTTPEVPESSLVRGQAPTPAFKATSGTDATKPSGIEAEGQAMLPEKGALTPQQAQDAAWKDIQPQATDKNIAAYRDQGATNPKTLTKGVTLNPTAADKQVLNHLGPMYEDGTLKPGMTTEEKVSTIEGKSRELARTADQYVEDNNKVVDVTSKYPQIDSLDKRLATAKKGNNVIFAGDTSLENAYDSVSQEFKSGLTKGGKTTTDTVSLRDRLKTFDAEMQGKFPNVYKNARTGELNPTDNARYNAIRDVHSTVRDLIADKVGGPYKNILQQNSSLIKAAQMVNENASNASKLDAFVKLIKDHPYFATFAGWEAFKHTVAPGLPGL